jgi:hypothetical protein
MCYYSGKEILPAIFKGTQLLHPSKMHPTRSSELIGYIIDDKMTIKAAFIKANMSPSTGYRHYHLYLKDQQGD